MTITDFYNRLVVDTVNEADAVLSLADRRAVRALLGIRHDNEMKERAS